MVLNEKPKMRNVAETIIAMRLKMDPEVIAKYLPAPFTKNREGEITIMMCDLYANDEAGNELAESTANFVYPYYTNMQEGLIAVPCKMEGTPGLYLYKVWENKDWGVQRGPMLGYNTELAEVHINRFPGRLRKLYAPHIGSKIKGVVRTCGEVVMSGWIELTEEVDAYPEEEYLTCFGRRHVEDMMNPDQLLIDDVLLEYHDSEKKGKVYKGIGHLTLGGELKDWDFEIVDAYFFDIGFSTSGWRVLKDMKQK